jgi:hypothetical protein
VARELEVAISRDPAIDAAKRAVAQKQLNSRLRAYGDVLTSRNAPEPTSTRLGRALFSFTNVTVQPSPADFGRAGEILAGYLEDANSALRKEFGIATLPENVPPSEIVVGKGR